MNLKEAQEQFVRDAKYRQQYEKLGDRVALAMRMLAIRKSLKLTKAALAKELGIQVSQISKVENLASTAKVHVTALLVDRFQKELRLQGMVIDHWLPIAEDAKRLARLQAEEAKFEQKPQGVQLPRGRNSQLGLNSSLTTGGRINILEEAEVEYWAERFGVNRSRLVEAVRRVGASAEAVRKELKDESSTQ